MFRPILEYFPNTYVSVGPANCLPESIADALGFIQMLPADRTLLESNSPREFSRDVSFKTPIYAYPGVPKINWCFSIPPQVCRPLPG